MAKIVTYASTKANENGFSFENPKLLIEQIKPIKGLLRITIETIDGDATDAQIYHFRSVVVPAFMFEAGKLGNDYTEKQAENELVQMFSDAECLDDLIDNGKQDVSKLIDKSKQFLREWFKIDI